ncbi:MAG TPA: hypothetical protein VLA97_09200 [Nocardioidaceae bacterium]|jgi:hypothetical protein|nr:hypothetical protein [Nocardioidaceae bacterium]
MSSVVVTTLGNIRLVASYVYLREDSATEPKIVFHDEQQQPVAALPVTVLKELRRTLPLRRDDAAWDLGPIEVARLNNLTRRGVATRA